MPESLLPIRIQFVCYDKLTAEVIVHQKDADSTYAHYMQQLYKRNKPMGGAISQRADLPRYWNVPVGTNVNGEN